MAKKQLIALFMCNFAVFAVGSGLVPLLPIYAARLGADSVLTGYYLAFAFAALAVSAVVAGWLSNRLRRRKALLVAAGVLIIPAVWLMGQVTTVIGLTVLTTIVWFMAGVTTTIVSILTGLFVHESERGRVFGIIGLAAPVAGIIGGFASGAIVDRWGYQALFTVDALVYLILPTFGLLLVDKPAGGSASAAAVAPSSSIMRSRIFLLLFFASILAHVANSQIVLGRSLIMDGIGFDATAISGTGAIGSIITLPLPVLIGWLSDRIGRKSLIMICYVASLIGLGLLAWSTDLWHFWVAMALQSVIGAGVAVGSALITDFVPRHALATALSVYGSTQFIGYVIGLGGMGTVIKWVGLPASIIIGMTFCGVALLLMARLPRGQMALAVSD